MRGNILYHLINSGVLQNAQFYLFRLLFWRTPSTLKNAKSSPPLATGHVVYVYWIDTVCVQNNLPNEFSKRTIFKI